MKSSKNIEKKHGFTLIELAITLVIIGLLVGGVLVGKTLIQQAEVRNAVSQLIQIETAYNTFKLKYNCIIGDCPNATDYFGVGYIAMANGCVMPNGAGNGDGNGIIDDAGGGHFSCEPQQAIKGISLANLLPKSLIVTCSGYSMLFKGINDGCAVFYNDDLYGTVAAQKQNSIAWFRQAVSTGSSLDFATLSPVQARLIDEKIDDGKPTIGKFRGLDAALVAAGTGVIITNSCSTSGVYNQNEDFTCRSLYYFK